MKQENLLLAITILSKYHSNKVEITNSENGFSDGKVRLFITNCVPAAINNLKDEGFSLSMVDGKLQVEDYAV